MSLLAKQKKCIGRLVFMVAFIVAFLYISHQEKMKQNDTFITSDYLQQEKAIRMTMTKIECITKIEADDEKIHFLDKNETKHKFRFQYPSFLFSHSGAGNTFTRLLIEHITGIWTGAIYKDPSLKSIGFKGEGICAEQYKVIAVKAHPEHLRLKFEDPRNLLTACFGWRKSVRIKWDYTTAIFIVRDPWKAMFAMFNFMKGRKEKQQNRHTSLVQRKNWNITIFKRIIQMDTRKGRAANSIFVLLELYKKYNFKHIVVKFETFFSNESEASLQELNKIAKFLYNDEYYEKIQYKLSEKIRCIKDSLIKNNYGRFGIIHRSVRNDTKYVSLDFAINELVQSGETKILCDFWEPIKPYALKYNYTLFKGINCSQITNDLLS